MKKILSFGLCVILVSCSKREAQEGTSPVNEFPTVDEAALKGVARTRFDSPNPTPEQLARRTRNNKIIRNMGLPVLETLPVVEDGATAKFRSSEAIAKRCLATTICAVKGETNDLEFVDSLIKDYSASSYFSPSELLFIKNPKPEQQNLIDFAWRYECVHVFVWAMDARESLAAPKDICPVSEDMKLVKESGPGKFVAMAKRRPTQEILDAADLYYRLHWAAVELRLKGKKSDLLDEGVIRERHRALNWLIGHLNQDWDDVTTDT